MNPEPSFEQIPIRMLQLGVDRPWLAEQCDYTPDSLRQILAPNGKGKTNKALRRIWEALDREESRQSAAKTNPPFERQQLVLRPTDAEYEQWCRAANGKPTNLWAIEMLNEAASRWNAAASPIPLPAPDLEKILAFPEIPLFHAAAGSPIAADGDTYSPTKEYKPGRIACRLHGDSMAPRFQDGSIVILRSKANLKRPILKRGEIYLFDIGGERTLKTYASRPATKAEIKSGVSYISAKDGTPKVRVLRSINPAFAEIVLTPEDDPDWLAWLDPKDPQP